MIPRAPLRLALALDRQWHGAPSREVCGRLELSRVGGDLQLRALLRQAGTPRVPTAPPGTRVEGLWNFDVVECFLAGSGGRYLEIEIGASAHFLLLAFHARRLRAHSWPDLRLPTSHGRTPDGAWWAALRVPGALLPSGLRAANACAIAAGRFLAYHPLPGPIPDFHQPSRWPAARLAER